MAAKKPAPAPDDNVEDLKAAEAKDLHRAVREEGEAELERPTSSLFWSGVAAGLAVGASIVTQGAIHHALPAAPWREAVVALGYPVGFLIVILGRMQLFTESTVTAMLPLVYRPSWNALGRTLRLWGVVLGANLIGTALVSAALSSGAVGLPGLSDAMLGVADVVRHRDALGTFLNAIPAGFLIAMVAWVLPNAREQAFFVIFAITAVVALGGFSHSILGSVEAFMLFYAGTMSAAQTLFGVLVPAILGNLLGGAGLFALLAHAQVREEMNE